MRVAGLLALVLQVGEDLVLDQLLGHGDLELLEELLEQGVAGERHAVALGVLLGLDLEVLLELVDGVELGGHLGELVVGLGQLAHLHGLRGDLDLRLLARAVAAGELRDEGGGLLGGQADERLVEALEHVALADAVGDALDGLDLLVVDGGDHVEGDEVAVLGRAVHAHEGAEALAQLVQAHLDGVGVDLGLLDLDLVGGEVGQLDLGADVLLDGEEQVALLGAVQARHLGDLDLGAADGLELRLGRGLLVEVGQGVVDGLLHDRGAAEALLDELGGDLALAEAGDLHLIGDLRGGRLDGGLELVEGHLDGELHPGGAELLGLGLHWSGLPVDGHRMDDSGGAPELARRRPGGGVGVTGFEPATSRSQSGCSTKLSYTPEGNPGDITRSARAAAGSARGPVSRCMSSRPRRMCSDGSDLVE